MAKSSWKGWKGWCEEGWLEEEAEEELVESTAATATSNQVSVLFWLILPVTGVVLHALYSVRPLEYQFSSVRPPSCSSVRQIHLPVTPFSP